MSKPTTQTMFLEELLRLGDRAAASYQPVPQELRHLPPDELDLELLNRGLEKMRRERQAQTKVPAAE